MRNQERGQPADLPSLPDVLDAAARIRSHAIRTPVLRSSTLDAMFGTRLFFKCENFQRAGAFKFRGACNAVFSLSEDDARRGVATHSSGNHGAALALAARLRGIPCRVVMPRNAPDVKKAAVSGYGAEIDFCAPTLAAREEMLEDVVAQTNVAVVHPYDDSRVIAGQGTVALELIDDVPDLDYVLTPIGGGGLTAGTALAVKSRCPRTSMVAVEPEGADDAYRSFRSGERLPSVAPQTIADGLLTSVGVRNFALIRRYVDDIVTVGDPAIIRAMRLVWERMKTVVEPSAAVPLAALVENRLDVRGMRVGMVLSGGNVDLDRLPW
ncbi:MAG: pyridoxal-phosphate dependent enzyme [Gammaproteobacteria bacterium]|nr:pyridoxal-phosphate dependent enzyme [Gammaproteobacteria bacterium]